AQQGPEGGGQDARHKLPGIKQVKSPSCRIGFCVSVVRPACRHVPPVALRLPGPRISATCWPRGHQCRKVTDVNRSLLQPAAHTSNSITDTVAPDRPFQSALSP
ncbi:hypothetical protein CKF46_17905, partial [Klebsiella pneumoniae]